MIDKIDRIWRDTQRAQAERGEASAFTVMRLCADLEDRELLIAEMVEELTTIERGLDEFSRLSSSRRIRNLLAVAQEILAKCGSHTIPVSPPHAG